MAEHIPVLLAEVMEYLAPAPGDVLLDATVGHGGHARAFLEATAPDGRVVGLDADPAAIEQASANLVAYGGRVQLHTVNFSQLKDSADGGGIVPPSAQHQSAELRRGFEDSGSTDSSVGSRGEPRVASEAKWGSVYTHILFDLGIGSHQLADDERGFSFQSVQGLGMRYGNGTLPPSQFAAVNQLEERLGRYPDVPDLLAQLETDDLADIIYGYGEERFSRRIAAAIQAEPLPQTGAELAQRISENVPGAYAHGRIHPATRTFQALRLAVNRELEALTVALPQAVALLSPLGKIAVISFHSLEDRIVKHFFKKLATKCVCPPEQPVCTCGGTATLQLLTKRPVRASEEEVARNPRARSAKLRIAQRIAD